MTKTDRPVRERGGFTLLVTGLSGSGKTTLAAALQERIVATTDRLVTLLDGDVMRVSLSADLVSLVRIATLISGASAGSPQKRGLFTR